MNKWIRKSLFVFISILTFGLVTPAQLMNAVNAESPKDQDVFEIPAGEDGYSQGYFEETKFNRERFIREMILQAETQSYQKFGQKIKPVIENEFRDLILPNMEAAIEQTALQFPEEDLKNLVITEEPGAGYSEKIFHIKNSQTGKDILRFHVRRDMPPQSGYWFNFHYHTFKDNFQTHHNLGAIYWAKNTPPKWMN
ncbi:YpjP family protein [Neobacillus rhizophilus]|uniref:YpjP family protein n=1 Tax=Neobacillus rhizophilus TaxID=2833579 RepID=A0A942UET1_9BACI|nr:YpjP family protein [Neobacillus rhizophilus]MBS4215949.1 YpjP family protein [Neobacillus rhizophilus]